MIYIDRFDKIAATKDIPLLDVLSLSFQHAQMGSLYMDITQPVVIQRITWQQHAPVTKGLLYKVQTIFL